MISPLWRFTIAIYLYAFIRIHVRQILLSLLLDCISWFTLCWISLELYSCCNISNDYGLYVTIKAARIESAVNNEATDQFPPHIELLENAPLLISLCIWMVPERQIANSFICTSRNGSSQSHIRLITSNAMVLFVDTLNNHLIAKLIRTSRDYGEWRGLTHNISKKGSDVPTHLFALMQSMKKNTFCFVWRT